jgi:hypothetical protein
MFMHVFNSKNSDRKNPSPRFDKIDGLFKDTRVEMVSYVLRKGLVDEDWSGFSRVVKPPADIELKAAENV